MSFAGGGRLEVCGYGARQDLPVRIHDSVRAGHRAHHLPRPHLLRQQQTHRHSLLEDRQEETRAPQDGLRS